MADIVSQVGIATDDGVWRAGAFNSATDSILSLGTYAESDPYRSFALFRNISIPRGTKISSAYISFTFFNYVNDIDTVEIYFENANSPAPISSIVDGDSRVKTTQHVSWEPPIVPTNTRIDTPDLSSVIQELVDSYSYNNQTMQLIIIGSGSGTINKRILVYSYYPPNQSYSPILYISTAPGGAGRLIGGPGKHPLISGPGKHPLISCGGNALIG